MFYQSSVKHSKIGDYRPIVQVVVDILETLIITRRSNRTTIKPLPRKRVRTPLREVLPDTLNSTKSVRERLKEAI